MDGELAAIVWFSFGETYRARGGILPLRATEAELIQTVTEARFRGRGLSPLLTRYSAWKMREHGFERLVAKVWRDNYPSMRAFEKAGWKEMTFFVRVVPRGIGRPLVWEWRKR